MLLSMLYINKYIQFVTKRISERKRSSLCRAPADLNENSYTVANSREASKHWPFSSSAHPYL